MYFPDADFFRALSTAVDTEKSEQAEQWNDPNTDVQKVR